MSHYDTPSREEKKRRRKLKKEKRKAVRNILKQDPQPEIEEFIAENDKTKRQDIVKFIQDKYINEDWLHELLDSKWVARDVFDQVKDSYRWPEDKDDKRIVENTETWYTYEKVDIR